jgi:outer membrane protein OmpA-like peptidoglycan-associated protein
MLRKAVTVTTRSGTLRGVFVSTVTACLMAACSGPTSPQPDSPATTSTTTPTGPASDAPADLPTSVVAPECEEAPGRTVEQLEDVTVPATVVPAVVDASGQEVAPASEVPAQLVDAGCVIRYDAPGGCLGAVEVTAATIPAATIPGVELTGVELPAATTDTVTQAGDYAPEVCQLERDGRIETVSRAGVVREGFSRDGVARPGRTRPERCDDDGCTPALEVPTVRLEPVRLPDVDIDPGRLESRTIARDVSVVSGEDRVSYVAPGAVLFELERAELRPAAEEALRTILDTIDPTAGTRLLVEGHTDDLGSASFGRRLSRQRAQTVADWLVDRGLRRSQVTVAGLGESAPAVPNTSEANRARNRRVVITVLR